jgi:hypothetical protein
MKVDNISDAAFLHAELQKLREAVEKISVKEQGRARIYRYNDFTEAEVNLDGDILVDALKEQIGRIKDKMRKLGIEFPKDKE